MLKHKIKYGTNDRDLIAVCGFESPFSRDFSEMPTCPACEPEPDVVCKCGRGNIEYVLKDGAWDSVYTIWDRARTGPYNRVPCCKDCDSDVYFRIRCQEM